MKNAIDKVGGILLSDKRILVVGKKHTSISQEYILPGGKREPGETDAETLKRELKEEISVDITSMDFFGEFEDIAIYENIPIIVKAYIVTTNSKVIPQNEIKNYLWVDRYYNENGIRLGSILSEHIIPELIKLGLM